MILLFAFAAAVQFNDENPMFWILGYSAAAILSLLYALQWKIQKIILVGLAIFSGVWAATMIPDYTLQWFSTYVWRCKNVAERRKRNSGIFGTADCLWLDVSPFNLLNGPSGRRVSFF